MHSNICAHRTDFESDGRLQCIATGRTRIGLGKPLGLLCMCEFTYGRNCVLATCSGTVLWPSWPPHSSLGFQNLVMGALISPLLHRNRCS